MFCKLKKKSLFLIDNFILISILTTRSHNNYKLFIKKIMLELDIIFSIPFDNIIICTVYNAIFSFDKYKQFN